MDNTCVSTPETLAESKAAQTAGLVIVVLSPALATLFVSLRIWSRSLLKTFTWDDILILIALSLSIAQAGATWKFSIISHTGYHTCDTPIPSLDTISEFSEWLLIQQLLYNPILVFVKASVLIFLYRFNDKRWYIKRSLQTLFLVNIALGIGVFFADLFQCTPVRYMYDSISMDIEARLRAGVDPNIGLAADGTLIKGGHCIQQTAFVLSSAAITTFTEVLTLLIPMAMIWTLKINKRKKIIIITILSLGWIVVGVSIARIVIFSRILDRNLKDSSYGAQSQISSIEINLAIIVACAPSLKALAKRLAPRFLSTKGYGNRYQYDSRYGKRSQPSNSMGSSAGGRRNTGPSSHYRRSTMDGMVISENNESQEKIFDLNTIEKVVDIDIEMHDVTAESIKSAEFGQRSHPRPSTNLGRNQHGRNFSRNRAGIESKK